MQWDFINWIELKISSLSELKAFQLRKHLNQDLLSNWPRTCVTGLLPSFFFQMRFLDCREGRKDPSKSILDVGVKEAICFSGFDEKMFLKRGGKYVWSKADMRLEWWQSAAPFSLMFVQRSFVYKSCFLCACYAFRVKILFMLVGQCLTPLVRS